METLFEYPVANVKCPECHNIFTVMVKSSMFKSGQKIECRDCGTKYNIKPAK